LPGLAQLLLQATQLKVLVLLCDFITQQDSPSAAVNIPVNHSDVLRRLTAQLPASSELAGTACVVSTLLAAQHASKTELEEALLGLTMQENASASVCGACCAHVIAQGQAGIACQGLLQALQRFKTDAAPLLAALKNIRVCLSSKSIKLRAQLSVSGDLRGLPSDKGTLIKAIISIAAHHANHMAING
jgi:hypothetical protein